MYFNFKIFLVYFFAVFLSSTDLPTLNLNFEYSVESKDNSNLNYLPVPSCTSEFYCTYANSRNNIISEPQDPDVRFRSIPDAVLRTLVS